MMLGRFGWVLVLPMAMSVSTFGDLGTALEASTTITVDGIIVFEGPLSVTSTRHLRGNATLDGAGPLFHVSNAMMTLEDLTLQHGRAMAGGCIAANASTVVLSAEIKFTFRYSAI